MYIEFEGESVPHDVTKWVESASQVLIKHFRPIDFEDFDVAIEFFRCDRDLCGELICEDSGRNPRTFTIRINMYYEEQLAETLIHEFVHLNQYASNRLRKTLSRAEPRTTKTYWKGKLFPSDEIQKRYADSDLPWEREAIEAETSLMYLLAKC